jgi:hypothetical protein
VSVLRWLKTSMVCCLLASANGCKQTPQPDANAEKTSNAKVELRTGDGTPAVVFDIKVAGDSAGTPGVLLYDCTYQSGGKIAKFRLQYKITDRFVGRFPWLSPKGNSWRSRVRTILFSWRTSRRSLKPSASPRKFRELRNCHFLPQSWGKSRAGVLPALIRAILRAIGWQ